MIEEIPKIEVPAIQFSTENSKSSLGGLLSSTILTQLAHNSGLIPNITKMKEGGKEGKGNKEEKSRKK